MHGIGPGDGIQDMTGKAESGYSSFTFLCINFSLFLFFFFFFNVLIGFGVVDVKLLLPDIKCSLLLLSLSILGGCLEI